MFNNWVSKKNNDSDRKASSVRGQTIDKGGGNFLSSRL